MTAYPSPPEMCMQRVFGGWTSPPVHMASPSVSPGHCTNAAASACCGTAKTAATDRGANHLSRFRVYIISLLVDSLVHRAGARRRGEDGCCACPSPLTARG